MPSKKRKYNARFPQGRIKRIMQADEEVGKIAHAVPVIISRTLELFVENLLTKSSQITLSRNAKTLSPTHLKQCIMSESRFDFLKDLVKNVPDIESGPTNEHESHHQFTSNNSSLGQEHHHHQLQQQQSVPVSFNGLENGSSSSSSTITTTAAARVYQRSQSFQPSTSSQTQYHNPIVQQKQFHLNNYTSTTAITHQNVKPNNIEYQPPTKIVRINSTPSSTITSEQQQQQHHHHNHQNKQSLTPLEFPIQISYNIDGSTSTVQSPLVKIDYSKLSLPATSPSIKIDLSNFNSQQVSATPIQIQPSSNTSSNLDEDYDA
ncbi:hypothetical protein PVAND_002393 [Polypedilum vanderplanki]|uniref:Dr1-associated corepressor n=1 Tax=Polypedilum vanderplanki TaxID=319348 RepID=A0A9J6BS13_POLVA|nr:hypothetical protein PVAND_002393 [Polypedilum vanderplanki]